MSFTRTASQGPTGDAWKVETYSDGTHELTLTYPHDHALPLDIQLTSVADYLIESLEPQIATAVAECLCAQKLNGDIIETHLACPLHGAVAEDDEEPTETDGG